MTHPADDADFKGRVQQLEGLLRQIEAFADPEARATALIAVQTLMEFHGAAVAKIVDHLAAGGSGAQAALKLMGQDDLISSLFLLYGVHPADFKTRVNEGVEKARSAVRNFSATLETVSIEDAAVRLRVNRTGHACGSTAAKIKTTIEDVLFERAPEITSIHIDGLAHEPSSGFVPVEQLFTHNAKHKSTTGDTHDSQRPAEAGAC